MMLFVAFLLLIAANICLCLSLDKHHNKLIGRALAGPVKATLRTGGYALLLVSLALVILSDAYLGLVYWCGLFSLAAMPLPFIVAHLDQRSRIH